MHPKNLKTKLLALVNSYRADLPEKIKTIKQLWNVIHSQNPNHANTKTQIKLLHEKVHNLCGTAGTYGYMELSNMACDVQNSLELYLRKPSLKSKQNILNLINSLEQIASKKPNKDISVYNFPRDKSTAKVIYFLATKKWITSSIFSRLELYGYKIEFCNTLLQLQKLLDKQKPSCIIANIALHKNNKTLQQFNLMTQASPLIFLAEQGDLVTRLKAVQCNAKAFFTEPFELEKLIEKIDQLTGITTSEPPRILIIDDSAATAEYYASLFQHAGMETLYITSALLLVDKINEFKPDLILMDIYMPNYSGIELVEVLRQQEAYATLPIVFLSAEKDKFRQLKAMNIGADDFIQKPIVPKHLILAVINRVQRYRLLRSLTVKDGLTGVLNHTAIQQRLELEMKLTQRQNTFLSCVMVDLDHFKDVNDQYGHLIGDQILRSLCMLLQSRLRATDAIGRYGGEEFMLILPHTDGKTAKKIIDSIREEFANTTHTIDHHAFHVTLSAGIASYPFYESPKSILDAADQALYQAKNAGRNNIILI